MNQTNLLKGGKDMKKMYYISLLIISLFSSMVQCSAIYCPFRHIEPSYRNTIFAQSLQWMNLLQFICPEDMSFIAPEWTVG